MIKSRSIQHDSLFVWKCRAGRNASSFGGSVRSACNNTERGVPVTSVVQMAGQMLQTISDCAAQACLPADDDACRAGDFIREDRCLELYVENTASISGP
jgi:hypothetical protein